MNIELRDDSSTNQDINYQEGFTVRDDVTDNNNEYTEQLDGVT